MPAAAPGAASFSLPSAALLAATWGRFMILNTDALFATMP